MPIHCHDGTLTSVCRMAARCSLAVRDSLSTSMCCLLSENWLVSVSSLVCRPKSSVSFRDKSCFTWSICARQTLSLNVWKTLQKTASNQTVKLWWNTFPLKHLCRMRTQQYRMKSVVSGLTWEQNSGNFKLYQVWSLIWDKLNLQTHWIRHLKQAQHYQVLANSNSCEEKMYWA